MFGMKKAEQAAEELVEVRGKVLRFGIKPFWDSSFGYTVLLEDNPNPYTVDEENMQPGGNKKAPRSFVELTQPGDIVSFTVRKGFLTGSNFRNESLPPKLVETYGSPDAK